MKMTRLEWRYLQRIALDHPYFDTHKLPLTEKEAKAIVEANITMTGREFVDSIYAKLGMTRPQEEKKERFAWLRSIGELFTVPPIRKIAIVVLVVVLMTVFFATTPTGRAIAESVIQYIIQLIDHNAIVSSDSVDIGVEFLSYSSVERINEANITSLVENNTRRDSITENIGEIPFTLPLQCENYSYINGTWQTLVTEYHAPKGRITIVQLWSCDPETVLLSTDGYQVYEKNNQILYTVDGSTGSISCICLLDTSVLYVYASEKIESDYLFDLLLQGIDRST